MVIRSSATDLVKWTKLHGHSEENDMKYFYWCIAITIAATVIAVLFIPGVDDFVEQTFQRYLGQAAR